MARSALATFFLGGLTSLAAACGRLGTTAPEGPSSAQGGGDGGGDGGGGGADGGLGGQRRRLTNR